MPNEDPSPGHSPNERRYTIWVCPECGDWADTTANGRPLHTGCAAMEHPDAERVEVMPVPSSQEDDDDEDATVGACTCPKTIGGDRVKNLGCPVHGDRATPREKIASALIDYIGASAGFPFDADEAAWLVLKRLADGAGEGEQE